MSILLDNFNTLVNSPKKIDSMKIFALDLAIQGKLATHNKTDVPASKLLQELSNINTQNSSKDEIKQNIELFEIPNNWKWAKLKDVIVLAKNLNIHTQLNSDSIINYVDINAIDNQKYCINENDIKVENVCNLSSRARRILEKDQILYSLVRPYLNNIAIVEDDKENYIGSTGLAVFKTLIESKYVFYYLLSSFIRKYYLNLLKGFNSPSITQKQFLNTYIPIPPLDEQKRITNKLDFLFEKFNILNLNLENLQDIRSKLNLSLIKNLYATEDNNKILNTMTKDFNNIFVTSESVNLLKDSILDLAIRGRLTSQNKSDEHANILFKKIVDEKRESLRSVILNKN